MEPKIIEQLGLTKNEFKIYKILLKLGNSTTGPIMGELGISSSRTYASLNNLIKKGLVTYHTKNNIKYYQASNPESLLKISEELTLNTSNLVKELKTIKQEEEPEESSIILEGFNGFKQAFEILLKECTKNDEVYTIGFSPLKFGFQTVRTYLKNVDKRRNKKKIPMKILLDTDLKHTIGKDREKEKYTKVKYLSKGYIVPTALSIFKDYVILWVWKEKITIFVIKNKDVNKSFRTYFEMLWSIAK